MYQDSKSNLEDLSVHLSICEFCAAEVDLYSRFPPAPEAVEPATIPQPLFDLADALLHKKRDMTPLYRLVERRD